jgi:hypothetical protein
MDGHSVLEAVAASRCAKEDVHLPGGHLISREVDLLERATLHWSHEDAGLYIMANPDGSLVLEPVGDRYNVLLLRRGDQPVMLGRDLPASYAQGVAEDVARRRGWAHLTHRDAVWRSRPASEKQINLLADLTGVIVGDLTAGDASDRISTYFTMRELRKLRRQA